MVKTPYDSVCPVKLIKIFEYVITIWLNEIDSGRPHTNTHQTVWELCQKCYSKNQFVANETILLPELTTYLIVYLSWIPIYPAYKVVKLVR